MNHNTIFEGETTSINIEVSVTDLPEGTVANSITVSKGDTIVDTITSSNTLSATDSISATTTYTVEVVLFETNVHKSVTKTVTAVGHIYYGSGSSKANFWSNKVAYGSAVTSPYRSYSVTVRTTDDRVYFAVPSSMTINGATLNGFDFPLNEVDTTSYSGFNLYESSNTYETGTNTIIIN